METIEFNVADNPASVTRVGDASGVIGAGKHLQIRTSPAGDELLDYEVPVGKVASIRVYVVATETDA